MFVSQGACQPLIASRSPRQTVSTWASGMTLEKGRARLRRPRSSATGKSPGWYEERLSEQAGVSTLAISPATTRMSWFVYVVRFAAGIDRQAVARRLEGLGIPSRPYFTPIHLQPYFVERFGYQPGDFPVAEDLGRRTLALPFSSVLTEAQVETVCGALGEAMAG